MSQNFSGKQVDEILQGAEKNLSKNRDKIQKMSKQSPDEILKQLKPEDAKKITEIMKNKALTEQIMNSPQAKLLMKQIMGDKGGK